MPDAGVEAKRRPPDSKHYVRFDPGGVAENESAFDHSCPQCKNTIMIMTTLCLLFALTADPAAPKLTENQKIESLIKIVAELKDAKFIRNGKEHDAKTAADHLRKKWDYAKKEVKTARDFIDKIATKSYLGGKPYLIRFADGREFKAADYLSERLKEIENSP